MTDLYHRACTVESTHKRIQPSASLCGITRLLDLTQLDCIGIPTYAATRPTGKVINVSNGKGATAIAAKVSALMEGIETFHAENPNLSLISYSSEDELRRGGLRFLSLDDYLRSPGCLSGSTEFYYSSRQTMRWTMAAELWSGEEYHIPASSVYYMEPFAHSWCSNGLASGNTYDEAVCHALYECIERDAFSHIVKGDFNAYGRRTYLIDTETVPSVLASVLDGFSRAGIITYLFALPCLAQLHTFCFFSVASFEDNPLLRVNIGLGTHTSAAIAVVRAVTECAQARLTMIHGAREDLYWPQRDHESISSDQAQLMAWLKATRDLGQKDWASYLTANQNSGIAHTFYLQRKALCARLADQGHTKIFCADLKKQEIGIDVVKVLVPSLSLDRKILE